MNKTQIKIAVLSVIALFSLITISSMFYTVAEGHVGIVKRFGEAVGQEDPGVHMKLPFVDSISEIEIRTRKYQITMSASTTGKNEEGESELQMPSRVVISANWNIPKDRALEIYKSYGGLEQYEDRILDPKVTRSVKQVFPHYDIESIISDRESVRNEIEVALSDALAKNIVTMSAINIEDVKFNGKIAEAVTKKQVAKLQLQEQRDILATQDLRAQESTNVDAAKAAGIKLISIEKAAAIKREGLAEATAIKAKAKALKGNKLIVELTHEQNWNGSYVTTMMGKDVRPIMDVRSK